MEFVQGGDLYTLLRRIGVLNVSMVSLRTHQRDYERNSTA